MSPVYCSSATVSDLDVGGHVRAGAEPSTTLGYFDAIEEQKGLLPDVCYRKLIEQLPAVVYMDTVEESDPALYMSHQVEEMLGYAPGEWLYDPELWSKLLHPEDRDRVLSVASRARSTGEPFEAEYRLIACDGRVVWVLDEAVCVKSREVDCSAAWQGIILDITGRKKAEEKLKAREKLFRSTFEAAGVGMAHVTPDSYWLRVNDKLCEISGYSREELLGKTFLELTPPEDRQASLERVNRMLAGRLGPYSVERRYIRKDGSRVWVNLSISLVRKPSGEPDFFICVAENITGRKIAELVPEPLTGREMKVLCQIVAGKTNPQISENLCHSLSTVKLCVQLILTKLGATCRREAADRAVEIGLVSPTLRG